MADTNFSAGTVVASSWLDDVNTNTYAILSAVAGTNTITATGASTVTVGYPRGVAFRFIPQNTNTGAVTINISGLGVKNVTKYGTVPLAAGDIVTGSWAYIAYDGTQFQLVNPAGPASVAIAQTNIGLGGPWAFRNRIRNGDMLINQRALVSSTTEGIHLVDGWKLQNTATLRLTGSQSTSITTGSPYSAKLQTTTAGAPAAGDVHGLLQTIEGYYLNDLSWGTVNASPVTITAVVQSSITGTFAMSVRNGANNRSYVVPIVITAANVSQNISVVVPGDTTGTWPTDNTAGLFLSFHIAVGSTYATASTNTWLAGNFVGITGQTQLTSTLNATFQVTKVQLEKGSVATPYEWIPFDINIIRQRRYYYNSYSYGQVESTSPAFANACKAVASDANNAWPMFRFPVTMRTIPGGAVYNSGTGVVSSMRNSSTGTNVALNAVTFGSPDSVYGVTSAGAFVAGQVYDYHVAASAEL